MSTLTELFVNLVGNTHDGGSPASLLVLFCSFDRIQRLECGT